MKNKAEQDTSVALNSRKSQVHDGDDPSFSMSSRDETPPTRSNISKNKSGVQDKKFSIVQHIMGSKQKDKKGNSPKYDRIQARNQISNEKNSKHDTEDLENRAQAERFTLGGGPPNDIFA
jgi:hypothetical protein